MLHTSVSQQLASPAQVVAPAVQQHGPVTSTDGLPSEVDASSVR